jgi:L-malate glycosyltransferase
MIVCISIPCLSRGGTEIQTLSLAKVLRSCGLEVYIVCYFEHEESMVLEFKNIGAIVRLLDLSRNVGSLKIIFTLCNEIRSINPVFVHVQYMAPGALPIIAARLAGVRNVFATVHQPYTKSHSWFAKLILRSVSLFTSRFIVISQNAEKSWFGTSSMFDENKPIEHQPNHFTIYNTVDTEKIQQIVESIQKESLRSQLKIPTGVPLVGAVSRLRHEKGIDLLIEAFSLTMQEGVNVHLLIVGSGPDEDKLKEQAVALGISDSITFFGAAEWDIAIRLISIMDIVIVPSRFEGFGLIAAEAMAAGKPVIASDNFGLKEVVADQESGLIFKTADISEIKEKLKLLLNEPFLCRQYGTAGQIRAKALFDTSVFQKKIAALYRNYI